MGGVVERVRDCVEECDLHWFYVRRQQFYVLSLCVQVMLGFAYLFTGFYVLDMCMVSPCLPTNTAASAFATLLKVNGAMSFLLVGCGAVFSLAPLLGLYYYRSGSTYTQSGAVFAAIFVSAFMALMSGAVYWGQQSALLRSLDGEDIYSSDGSKFRLNANPKALTAFDFLAACASIYFVNGWVCLYFAMAARDLYLLDAQAVQSEFDAEVTFSRKAAYQAGIGGSVVATADQSARNEQAGLLSTTPVPISQATPPPTSFRSPRRTGPPASASGKRGGNTPVRELQERSGHPYGASSLRHAAGSYRGVDGGDNEDDDMYGHELDQQHDDDDDEVEL